MKLLPRLFVLCLLLLSLLPQEAQAQAGLLSGKKIGLYISGKSFSFTEEYYLTISQFLKIDEDRSQVGLTKSEFMIRIGEMLTHQLDSLSGADTVIFLNADLQRGSTFMNLYDPEQNDLRPGATSSLGLDMVLVVSQFILYQRIHKSVFINSNRMVTDRIPVDMVKMQLTLTDLSGTKLRLPVETCYDGILSGKPAPYFDFLKDMSGLGKFLSESFSCWWDQMLVGNASNCDQE